MMTLVRHYVETVVWCLLQSKHWQVLVFKVSMVIVEADFCHCWEEVCSKPWHLLFARHNDAAGDVTVLIDACRQQAFCHLLFHLLVWHVVALLDPESNLGPVRALQHNAPLIESFVDCGTMYIVCLFTWLSPLTSFFLYLFFLTYFSLLIYSLTYLFLWE